MYWVEILAPIAHLCLTCLLLPKKAHTHYISTSYNAHAAAPAAIEKDTHQYFMMIVCECEGRFSFPLLSKANKTFSNFSHNTFKVRAQCTELKTKLMTVQVAYRKGDNRRFLLT